MNNIKENPLICCLTKYKYMPNKSESPVPHHRNKCIVGGHMAKKKIDNASYGDTSISFIFAKDITLVALSLLFQSETSWNKRFKDGELQKMNSEFLVTLLNLADKDGDIEFDLQTFCTENKI